MVSRVLITTALEETWPRNNEPILFLGEWCRLYSRKSEWKELDATVASYHWDNREKLYCDYIYLKALYEELLKELADHLNTIHGVNHTTRYWRILVGPWLGSFIQILFDRWAMLGQAQSENNFWSISLKRHIKNDKFVPNTTAEFISFFKGDEWNDFIYGQIAEWLKIPINHRDTSQHECEDAYALALNLKKPKLSSYLKRVVNQMFGFLGRDDGFFFISTYLDIKQNLRLQFKLGQVPQLWQSVEVSDVAMCKSARQWIMSGGGNQEFEFLVRTLIPKNIPKLYLEGYSNLVKVSNHTPWPKNPKIIFTSNSFIDDEVFKVWAAGKVERGTPLVVGQHGGNYGMALWNFIEDHQLAIADRYLTWGWTKKGQGNIVPIGNFKKTLITTPNTNGSALLVATTVPRQSYHMLSAPVSSGQWKECFQDQIRFVRALPENLRTKLLVRLSPQDWGHSQKERWKDTFPNIELDIGSSPITASMNRSRVSIVTYNATAYLESMALNFPTIIFWNPTYWELRQEAAALFEKLKKVGIFYETPEAAAKHIQNIWNDIHGWWFSIEVQTVRAEFCEVYARSSSDDIAQDLAETFRKILKVI